jgi:hypothetical protein
VSGPKYDGIDGVRVASLFFCCLATLMWTCIITEFHVFDLAWIRLIRLPPAPAVLISAGRCVLRTRPIMIGIVDILPYGFRRLLVILCYDDVPQIIIATIDTVSSGALSVYGATNIAGSAISIIARLVETGATWDEVSLIVELGLAEDDSNAIVMNSMLAKEREARQARAAVLLLPRGPHADRLDNRGVNRDAAQSAGPGLAGAVVADAEAPAN